METHANYLDELRQDIRYALRQLRRRPAFAGIIVGTLAIGIGANTAIFSVLKGVYLDPLPYHEPDRLTYVWHGSTDGTCCGPLSGPDFRDLREMTRTFDDLGVMTSRNTNLTGDGRPEMVLSAVISPGLLGLLGTQPMLGRTFTPADAVGDSRAVILSHSLWRDRYGGAPTIIGRTISLNREPYTVVGVLRPGFNVPSPWRVNQMHQLYLPLAGQYLEDDRGSHWLLAIGRLAAGQSVESGDRELKAHSRSLEEQYPGTNFQKTTYVQSMHEQLVGSVGTQLLMLLFAAGFMLLIVCGNVAALLLTKATGRETEMAIRAAVGADRRRILRQLLTENVVLAVLGGLAGVALAGFVMRLLGAMMPADLPRLENIRIDITVLEFALGVSVVTGLVVGLAPVLSASRTDLTESLKEGRGGAESGSRRSLLRATLVVFQFALALVLANGAALMVQSYLRFRGMEQGFVPENVLTVAISLQGERFEDTAPRSQFLDAVVERVSTIPGVRHVGTTSKLPLQGGSNNQVWAEEDAERPPPGGDGPLVEFSRVAAGYFDAMGIQLVAGRHLTADDTATGRLGAVINREMARRLWPDQDPIGKRFSFRTEPPEWITVVGIVNDVRQWGPYRRAQGENYLPYAALPERMPGYRMFLVMRTEGEPLSVVGAVRSAILAVDPDQPISEIRTMEQVVSNQFAGQRFNTMLASMFAAVALLLVAAGIYGVVSFHVARSTHEIGVRMALGAGRGRVLGLTLLRGLKLTVIGAAIGVGGIFTSTRLIRSMLYGADPIDFPTMVIGALSLIGVGALATLVPAYRAASVSPVTALRGE